MNLIEQLGGYEKAKNIIISNEDGDNFYSNYYEYYSDNSVYEDSINIMDIEKSLLEYRRENSIFENGDKIIFMVVGNSVMQWDDCLSMFLSQGLIRHATDAEIKAGHRL